MSRSVRRSVGRVLTLATAVAAAFGASVIPASAAPPINFAPAVNYATGGTGGSGWHETGSAAGDFNGDGKADVAVSDYFASNAFRVMLNQGSGTFASPGIANTVQFGVGTLVAEDFNNDGRDDIVATNVTTAFSLRSNGNGTFTQIASYPVFQGGQEDAQAADFNNDGRLDVAILQRYGVTTLLGNGNGTFIVGPQTTLPDFGGSGIDDARLNTDGNVDLVLSSGVTGVIYALKGNGNGSFTLTGTGLAPGVPGTVLAGDLNHDGLDDAVALAEFTGFLNGAVMLNNGAGGFGTATRFDAGLGPVSGELADLNNDGKLDLISADTVSNAMKVLGGNGNGTFDPPRSFATAQAPQTPVVADFNSDGKRDIAAAGVQGFGPTQLSVLRNIS